MRLSRRRERAAKKRMKRAKGKIMKVLARLLSPPSMKSTRLFSLQRAKILFLPQLSVVIQSKSNKGKLMGKYLLLKTLPST